MTASLREGRREGKVVGLSTPKQPAPDMAPKARGEPKNPGTPAADFGDFLREKLPEKYKRANDTKADEARKRFIDAIVNHGASSVGVEAVRKWEQGASSPPLKDLGAVSKALGYRNWFALVDAIKAKK